MTATETKNQTATPGTKVMTLLEAITDAMRTEMRNDDRVVVFGEDVGKKGGVFGATMGLQDEFGEQRCFDSPLSECGIIGTGVGMALYGLPPNEGWYAELGQVGADESVATMHLSRFAPDDEVALPARGTAFTTRRDAPLRCGVDTSAAVRAAITVVSAPADGVTLDADGYGYLDLEVDQGRGEGLAAGDRLYLEQDADGEARISGEGRVRQVGADSARVLWRTYRWLGAWEEDEDAGEGAAPVKVERSALPAVGQHLVTPAWRRVESDLFGALRGR